MKNMFDKITYSACALLSVSLIYLLAVKIYKDEIHIVTPEEIRQNVEEANKNWRGPLVDAVIYEQVKCDNPYLNDERYHVDTSNVIDGTCILKVPIKTWDWNANGKVIAYGR